MGQVCFNARVNTCIILVTGQICKTASIVQECLVSDCSTKSGGGLKLPDLCLSMALFYFFNAQESATLGC
jgi:hypothetical protein